MRHSSLNRILRLLTRADNKKLVLWDKAEPISLEELKAKLAEIARNEGVSSFNRPILDSETLTLEELWKIFESLEELEDCPLI